MSEPGIPVDRALDGASPHQPVMIAAFEGWNDAGNAASDAVRFPVSYTHLTLPTN